MSFTKRLTNEELVATYNQAHLVVCPSLYEGFGLPAAEAMACGCAVVATDGGALPEVIGNAGVIVSKADAEKLASAISQLFKNETQTQNLRNIARTRILENFCWHKVARDLTAYYQNILSIKSSHAIQKKSLGSFSDSECSRAHS